MEGVYPFAKSISVANESNKFGMYLLGRPAPCGLGTCRFDQPA